MGKSYIKLGEKDFPLINLFFQNYIISYELAQKYIYYYQNNQYAKIKFHLLKDKGWIEKVNIPFADKGNYFKLTKKGRKKIINDKVLLKKVANSTRKTLYFDEVKSFVPAHNYNFNEEKEISFKNLIMSVYTIKDIKEKHFSKIKRTLEIRLILENLGVIENVLTKKFIKSLDANRTKNNFDFKFYPTFVAEKIDYKKYNEGVYKEKEKVVFDYFLKDLDRNKFKSRIKKYESRKEKVIVICNSKKIYKKYKEIASKISKVRYNVKDVYFVLEEKFYDLYKQKEGIIETKNWKGDKLQLTVYDYLDNKTIINKKEGGYND